MQAFHVTGLPGSHSHLPREDDKKMDSEASRPGSPELGATGTEGAPAEKSKVDNTDFSAFTVDGQERFACHHCDLKADKVGSMKRHITAKHGKLHKAKGEKRRRSNGVEDSTTKKKKEDGGKEEEFDESVVDKYLDNDSSFTQSQIENYDAICEKYKNESNKEEVEVIENKVDEALKEENDELKAKLASLEEAMAEKEISMEICTGRNEALEREAIDRKAQIEKYRRVIERMEQIIKKQSGNQANVSEEKAKIKKLNEEVKEREKKIGLLEKRLDDAVRKVGEESNLRAKAEAEVLRSQKNIENLMRIVEKERSTSPGRRGKESTSNSERVECRDLSKPGGCKFGSKCKFYHPTSKAGGEAARSQDCINWMDGHCAFSDKCRYTHAQEKKGVRQGDNKQTKERQQGFAEALAMVREAIAGGTQQQQQQQQTQTQFPSLMNANLQAMNMGQQQQQQLQQQQQQQPMMMMMQPLDAQLGWASGPSMRH